MKDSTMIILNRIAVVLGVVTIAVLSSRIIWILVEAWFSR